MNRDDHLRAIFTFIWEEQDKTTTATQPLPWEREKRCSFVATFNEIPHRFSSLHVEERVEEKEKREREIRRTLLRNHHHHRREFSNDNNNKMQKKKLQKQQNYYSKIKWKLTRKSFIFFSGIRTRTTCAFTPRDGDGGGTFLSRQDKD